jgi:hypothetical protein
MKKKQILILLTLLVVASTIMFRFVAYPKIQAESKIFTQKKWESDIYKREPMVDGLLKSQEFKGKTHDDIKSILGNKGLVRDTKNTLSYVVGKGYIDPILLNFIFDENGMVKEYYIAPK